MNPPYTTSQRTSGMNWPVLRLADLILMQAEVKAELGAEGEAINYLTKSVNVHLGILNMLFQLQVRL